MRYAAIRRIRMRHRLERLQEDWRWLYAEWKMVRDFTGVEVDAYQLKGVRRFNAFGEPRGAR